MINVEINFVAEMLDKTKANMDAIIHHPYFYEYAEGKLDVNKLYNGLEPVT